MVDLEIYSGKVCLGRAGVETGVRDLRGRPVNTGDIVILYHDDGPDCSIRVSSPLTVVVQHDDGDFYTMGIRSVGVSSEEWPVEIAKKYHDVVPGEHWPEWGFSYRAAAEEARRDHD